MTLLSRLADLTLYGLVPATLAILVVTGLTLGWRWWRGRE